MPSGDSSIESRCGKWFYLLLVTYSVMITSMVCNEKTRMGMRMVAEIVWDQKKGPKNCVTGVCVVFYLGGYFLRSHFGACVMASTSRLLSSRGARIAGYESILGKGLDMYVRDPYEQDTNPQVTVIILDKTNIGILTILYSRSVRVS